MVERKFEYKTEVLHASSNDMMAVRITAKANEYAKAGWWLAFQSQGAPTSCTITFAKNVTSPA